MTKKYHRKQYLLWDPGPACPQKLVGLAQIPIVSISTYVPPGLRARFANTMADIVCNNFTSIFLTRTSKRILSFNEKFNLEKLKNLLLLHFSFLLETVFLKPEMMKSNPPSPRLPKSNSKLKTQNQYICTAQIKIQNEFVLFCYLPSMIVWYLLLVYFVHFVQTEAIKDENSIIVYAVYPVT